MTIDGLALRRKIAEAKGYRWMTFRLDKIGKERSRLVPPELRDALLGIYWDDEGPVPNCEPDLQSVPAWDSDPSEALTLWAELVAAGLFPTIQSTTEDGPGDHDLTEAFDSDGSTGFRWVQKVSSRDEPAPVRRFCLALCLLWLSWNESRKVS